MAQYAGLEVGFDVQQDELQTTRYLRDHGLDALCKTFSISARRHGQFPSLVQLKYRQIESPMNERIVQECRGLIVDEARDFQVVCRAYDKFFNHGEPNAAHIDWETATIYEKVDGSLMTLYWHEGAWRVASSGLPDAAGLVQGTDLNFAGLFWQTWHQLEYMLPTGPGEQCYVFELVTPFNRVIVSHARHRLVLHGVRDLNHGEHPPEPIAEKFGWECVATFPLRSFEDCLAAASQLNPMDGEGYVVRDSRFNRVKIKSPRYVALAHFKEGMNGRRLLDIVRKNETQEFLSYFPEFTAPFDRVHAAFDALCNELESDYARLQGVADQKAFAAHAMQTRCSSPLFAMRKGGCETVREFFAANSFQCLERAMGMDLNSLLTEVAES